MARKAKKTEQATVVNSNNTAANTAQAAAETTTNVAQTATVNTEANTAATTAQPTAPAERQKLIVVKKLQSGRWYVYFKGVRPEDNVGCGCKTPQKAMGYMFLLKKKHGAAIDQSSLDQLKAEAAKGNEATAAAQGA